MSPEQPGNPSAANDWPRLIFLAAGLLLSALAWLVLTPERWLDRLGPPGSASAAFNLGLWGELRAVLASLALVCLLAGLLWPRLPSLADWLNQAIRAGDRWLRAGRRWPATLLACTALAALAYAGYSITRHNHFNSKAYDLGLHAQVFWNTSQGRLFASSVEVSNYLGDHVSPIIVLLAPLYRLWPDPRSLLTLQALALSLGALPLAWLARRRLLSAWPEAAHFFALLLAVIYLTYPALGFVNRFEFHEEALAVPLLLLAFCFLDKQRLGAMSLTLLLTLLCKEDMGLLVAAFGAFAWQRSRRWSGPPSRRGQVIGLLWLVVGLSWSMLALLVVIPAWRGAQSDTLGRYAWLGSDTGQILANLLRHPGQALGHLLEPRRAWFLVKFLLPVGFLSLLSPAVLIALPILAVNWLAGNLYQASIYFHYAAPLIPIVFAASVYGLERAASGNQTGADSLESPNSQPRLSTMRPALLACWLIGCAVLAQVFDQFWQQPTGSADWENYGLERRVDAQRFAQAAALLPADGAVATTEAYAPHLANRQQLYLLYDPRIMQVAGQVDWVLAALDDHRYGVIPKFYYGLLRWIAEKQALETCYFEADVVLLGRGCAEPAAATAYRARLATLQRTVADQPLSPAMLEALGPRAFTPNW